MYFTGFGYLRVLGALLIKVSCDCMSPVCFPKAGAHVIAAEAGDVEGHVAGTSGAALSTMSALVKNLFDMISKHRHVQSQSGEVYPSRCCHALGPQLSV